MHVGYFTRPSSQEKLVIIIVIMCNRIVWFLFNVYILIILLLLSNIHDFIYLLYCVFKGELFYFTHNTLSTIYLLTKSKNSGLSLSSHLKIYFFWLCNLCWFNVHKSMKTQMISITEQMFSFFLPCQPYMFHQLFKAIFFSKLEPQPLKLLACNYLQDLGRSMID